MKTRKAKRNKYFSKREVVLFCICLLELFVIIYDIFLKQNFEGMDIAQDAFTFITSVICSILATAVLPKGLQADDTPSLSGDFENQIVKLIEKNRELYPSTSYVDTNDPNLEFNRRMNESISVTQSYVYFGDRALYLTKRLGKDIKTTNSRLKIVVFLADITDDSLFTSRSDVYLQRERSMQRDDEKRPLRNINEIINDEKIEILRSLYALGMLRHQYNIQVYLHKELPFIRFEITDRLLALSFLTQLSTGKRYPSTVVYENENIFKQNFEDYIKQVAKRSRLLTEEDFNLKRIVAFGEKANVHGCNEKSITSHYLRKVK